MKRCPDCGKYKDSSEFPRNKRTKDGLATYCKPCHNARGKAVKERLYGGSRHYHLLQRYGIGADDVAALIESQGGVCAICCRPDPQHVDHCQETGVIRGVLCFNCNGGLGQFRDDATLLAAAIDYLEVVRPVVRRGRG